MRINGSGNMLEIFRIFQIIEHSREIYFHLLSSEHSSHKRGVFFINFVQTLKMHLVFFFYSMKIIKYLIIQYTPPLLLWSTVIKKIKRISLYLPKVSTPLQWLLFIYEEKVQKKRKHFLSYIIDEGITSIL